MNEDGIVDEVDDTPVVDARGGDSVASDVLLNGHSTSVSEKLLAAAKSSNFMLLMNKTGTSKSSLLGGAPQRPATTSSSSSSAVLSSSSSSVAGSRIASTSRSSVSRKRNAASGNQHDAANQVENADRPSTFPKKDQQLQEPHRVDNINRRAGGTDHSSIEDHGLQRPEQKNSRSGNPPPPSLAEVEDGDATSSSEEDTEERAHRIDVERCVMVEKMGQEFFKQQQKVAELSAKILQKRATLNDWYIQTEVRREQEAAKSRTALEEVSEREQKLQTKLNELKSVMAETERKSHDEEEALRSRLDAMTAELTRKEEAVRSAETKLRAVEARRSETRHARESAEAKEEEEKLEALRAQIGAATTELGSLRAEGEALGSAIQKLREEEVELRTDQLEQQAAVKRQREEEAGSFETLRKEWEEKLEEQKREFAEREQEFADAAAGMKGEHERAMAELDAILATIDEKGAEQEKLLRDTAEEQERLVTEASERIAAEKTALASEKERAKAHLETLAEEEQQCRDEVERKREEMAKKLEEIRAELERQEELASAELSARLEKLEEDERAAIVTKLNTEHESIAASLERALQKNLASMEEQIRSQLVAEREADIVKEVDIKKAAIDAKLAAVQKKLDEAEARCADAAKECEDKQKEIDVAQSRIDALAEAEREALAGLEAERGRLGGEKQDFERQVADVRAQVQKRQADSAELAEKIKKQEELLSTSVANYALEEQKVAGLRQQSEALSDTNSALAAALAQLEEEKRIWLLRWDEEHTKREDQLGALVGEEEEKRKEVAEYRELAEAEKDKWEKLQEETAAQLEANERMDAEHEELTRALSELREDTKTATTRLKDLKEQGSALNEKISTETATLEERREDLANYERKAATAEKDMAGYEQQVSEKLGQLEEAEKRVTEALHEKERLEARGAELQSLVMRLEEREKAAGRHIQELEVTKLAEQDAVTALGRQKKQLEAEMPEQEARAERLLAEIAERERRLREEIARDEAEAVNKRSSVIRQLHEEERTLKKANDALQQEISNRKVDHAAMTSAIEEYRSKRKEYEERKETYQKEYGEMQRTIDELQGNIASLDTVRGKRSDEIMLLEERCKKFNAEVQAAIEQRDRLRREKTDMERTLAVEKKQLQHGIEEIKQEQEEEQRKLQLARDKAQVEMDELRVRCREETARSRSEMSVKDDELNMLDEKLSQKTKQLTNLFAEEAAEEARQLKARADLQAREDVIRSRLGEAEKDLAEVLARVASEKTTLAELKAQAKETRDRQTGELRQLTRQLQETQTHFDETTTQQRTERAQLEADVASLKSQRAKLTSLRDQQAARNDAEVQQAKDRCARELEQMENEKKLTLEAEQARLRQGQQVEHLHDKHRERNRDQDRSRHHSQTRDIKSEPVERKVFGGGNYMKQRHAQAEAVSPPGAAGVGILDESAASLSSRVEMLKKYGLSGEMLNSGKTEAAGGAAPLRAAPSASINTDEQQRRFPSASLNQDVAQSVSSALDGQAVVAKDMTALGATEKLKDQELIQVRRGHDEKRPAAGGESKEGPIDVPAAGGNARSTKSVSFNTASFGAQLQVGGSSSSTSVRPGAAPAFTAGVNIRTAGGTSSTLQESSGQPVEEPAPAASKGQLLLATSQPMVIPSSSSAASQVQPSGVDDRLKKIEEKNPAAAAPAPGDDPANASMMSLGFGAVSPILPGPPSVRGSVANMSALEGLLGHAGLLARQSIDGGSVRESAIFPPGADHKISSGNVRASKGPYHQGREDSNKSRNGRGPPIEDHRKSLFNGSEFGGISMIAPVPEDLGTIDELEVRPSFAGDSFLGGLQNAPAAPGDARHAKMSVASMADPLNTAVVDSPPVCIDFGAAAENEAGGRHREPEDGGKTNDHQPRNAADPDNKTGVENEAQSKTGLLQGLLEGAMPDVARATKTEVSARQIGPACCHGSVLPTPGPSGALQEASAMLQGTADNRAMRTGTLRGTEGGRSATGESASVSGKVVGGGERTLSGAQILQQPPNAPQKNPTRTAAIHTASLMLGSGSGLNALSSMAGGRFASRAGPLSRFKRQQAEATAHINASQSLQQDHTLAASSSSTAGPSAATTSSSTTSAATLATKKGPNATTTAGGSKKKQVTAAPASFIRDKGRAGSPPPLGAQKKAVPSGVPKTIVESVEDLHDPPEEPGDKRRRLFSPGGQTKTATTRESRKITANAGIKQDAPPDKMLGLDVDAAAKQAGRGASSSPSSSSAAQPSQNVAAKPTSEAALVGSATAALSSGAAASTSSTAGKVDAPAEVVPPVVVNAPAGTSAKSKAEVHLEAAPNVRSERNNSKRPPGGRGRKKATTMLDDDSPPVPDMLLEDVASTQSSVIRPGGGRKQELFGVVPRAAGPALGVTGISSTKDEDDQALADPATGAAAAAAGKTEDGIKAPCSSSSSASALLKKVPSKSSKAAPVVRQEDPSVGNLKPLSQDPFGSSSSSTGGGATNFASLLEKKKQGGHADASTPVLEDKTESVNSDSEKTAANKGRIGKANKLAGAAAAAAASLGEASAASSSKNVAAPAAAPAIGATGTHGSRKRGRPPPTRDESNDEELDASSRGRENQAPDHAGKRAKAGSSVLTTAASASQQLRQLQLAAEEAQQSVFLPGTRSTAGSVKCKYSIEDLRKRTVAEIKAILETADLKTTGKKEELARRVIDNGDRFPPTFKTPVPKRSQRAR